MKKEYKLLGLHCGNCAKKIERVISRNKKVKQVEVNFIQNKLVMNVEDTYSLEDFKKIKKRIESITDVMVEE